jgi:hypothetical protein
LDPSLSQPNETVGTIRPNSSSNAGDEARGS